MRTPFEWWWSLSADSGGSVRTAVAAITAIISHAMSSLTLLTAGTIFTGGKGYGTLGVATGELSILSLPLMYVARSCYQQHSFLTECAFSLTLDMAREKSYTLTVIGELVWLGAYWLVAV